MSSRSNTTVAAWRVVAVLRRLCWHRYSRSKGSAVKSSYELAWQYKVCGRWGRKCVVLKILSISSVGLEYISSLIKTTWF